MKEEIEETLDKINNIVKMSKSAREDVRFNLKELLSTQKKQLLEKIVELRDLKSSEKGKSIDYWEGYTMATSRIIKTINHIK